MSVIWAEKALTPSGWRADVVVSIGTDGKIETVEVGTEPVGKRVGCLLPAPVNAHSHGFQRSLAGLTESRGPGTHDSFWTWRKQMYRFLAKIDPDMVQATTEFVQMEMLEAGFATNVEFHYLHHQPNGTAYDNLAEMSERVIAAADQTGIGLTLLPVLYQYGGCDQRELNSGQVRFGNGFDQYAKLCELARTSLASQPDDAVFGVAAHSLRAVYPGDLNKIPKLAENGPVHMHLAEQIGEVEEVLECFGARPVEWVLGNVDISERWSMIHCTQMQQNETVGLASSGAIAGLCPITESNLGDGIFDTVNWFQNSGRIAIGSDSNIRISLSEEIRTLEYSQRLRDQGRALLATENCSTGRQIFDAICTGGAGAAGRKTGKISQGNYGDLLALDMNHVDLSNHTGDTILDIYAFAGDDAMVTDVWSAGRHMVQNGRHIDRDRIVSNYRKTTAKLKDAV